MITEETLQRAADHLDRSFGLDALWLFGSHARGTSRPDSDVDLAVLLKRRPAVSELFDTQLELAGVLDTQVDLVDLERVTPILVLQVLKQGRLVADKDSQRRIAFSSKTISLYEDLKILRREAEKILFERMSLG